MSADIEQAKRALKNRRERTRDFIEDIRVSSYVWENNHDPIDDYVFPALCDALESGQVTVEEIAAYILECGR